MRLCKRPRIDGSKNDIAMILYIDETENDDYFIITGLFAPSRFSVDEAYKHFKHRIKNFNLNNKTKEKVYREFKSVILDRNFQKCDVGRDK